MRELKFRAWDKEDKRMIIDTQEFIPLEVTSKGVLRLNASYKETFWEFADSKRFELMQFTGLRDSIGKDIYEGDVFKDHFGNRLGVVTYGEFSHAHKNNFLMLGSCIGFYVSWKEKHIRNDIGYWKKYKVIGNKFEMGLEG